MEFLSHTSPSHPNSLYEYCKLEGGNKENLNLNVYQNLSNRQIKIGKKLLYLFVTDVLECKP